MRRRRARSREIVFNFDSFLDLVANVVGIILRLILVVWVGARSYNYVVSTPDEPQEMPTPVATDQLLADRAKLKSATEKERLAHANLQPRIDSADALLRERAKAAEEEQEQAKMLRQDLNLAKQQLREASQLKQDLEAKEKLYLAQGQLTKRSEQDLVNRQRELQNRYLNLMGSPSKKKVLRYQAPVAAPIQSQELQFEFRENRVTFLDVNALLDEIRQSIRLRGDELRNRWRVEDATKAVGAFRLRYVISRQRTVFDSIAGGSSPNAKDDFRYGLDRWVAEPVTETRGEEVKKALLPTSDFRDVIDHLDPKTTAVTFWVYPDSFALYRKLRDYCARKGILVAGRPLPFGMPIASSKNGTASRGQ